LCDIKKFLDVDVCVCLGEQVGLASRQAVTRIHQWRAGLIQETGLLHFIFCLVSSL